MYRDEAKWFYFILPRLLYMQISKDATRGKGINEDISNTHYRLDQASCP
jgi:hypothetical protein